MTSRAALARPAGSTKPTAQATAPGRIVAAGTACGATLTTTVVAISAPSMASREPTPPTLVAPCRPSMCAERWLSSIAPQACVMTSSSRPARWLVRK